MRSTNVRKEKRVMNRPSSISRKGQSLESRLSQLILRLMYPIELHFSDVSRKGKPL